MARMGARLASQWSPDYTEKSSRPPFQVVIPNGELAQIQQWVREYPNLETGGDLFGLWSNDNTAVVQLVLGPGKNSRRTLVSYHQDTVYFAKAGSILTENYGLCHIGEWHSHHTLGLAQPSDGDQHTVWSNMPNSGFKRFVVFIANLDKEIKSRKSKVARSFPVGLGCFLFEVKDTKPRKTYEMLQGFFDVPRGQSPYRQMQDLLVTVREGAELINKNQAVTVVRLRSARHECSNILLYNEDVEFGGEVLERLPYQDETPQQGKPMSRLENPRTQQQQKRDQPPQPDEIIRVESAQLFNGTRMWESMENYEKVFLTCLQKELNGQLARDINEISVSFTAIVPQMGELACRLVWKERQDDVRVLKFYLPGSTSNFNEIRYFCHSHADPVQLVNEVKEEVKKHITAVVHRFTEDEATPFRTVNTKQQQQQK